MELGFEFKNALTILNYGEMRWNFNILHDIPPKILYHVKYEKGDYHADKDRQIEFS